MTYEFDKRKLNVKKAYQMFDEDHNGKVMDWSVGASITFEEAEAIFNEMNKDYTDPVLKLMARTNENISQQQFDALYIFGFNRPALLSGGKTLEKLVTAHPSPDSEKDYTTDITSWTSQVMAEYPNEKTKVGETNRKGWRNRTKDTLELYFNGNYTKDH